MTLSGPHLLTTRVLGERFNHFNCRWFVCMETLTVRRWRRSSSPTNAGAASIWYASFQITNWKYMLAWKKQIHHVWNIFTHICFLSMLNCNGNYMVIILSIWVRWSTYKPAKLDFFQQQFQASWDLHFLGYCFAMKLPAVPSLEAMSCHPQDPRFFFCGLFTGAMLRAPF